MAENLKIPASVDLEIRQAEAKAKVLADKVSASFQKIKIGGFDSSGLKAGSAALGRIRQDADQFTKSMEAANARVLAFGTAVGVIEGMRRSFLALVKTTVEVEKALTKVNIVAEKDLKKAGITIEQVGDQIFQVARETGQSWETAADAMLEFSRQGIKPVEALKRTRDALILSRISGLDYKEAVEGITSTINAFNKTAIDSTTIINKLVAVDNNAAASAADLIQGLQRMASTAQLTGQNIDDAVASIATLQEITFRGGPQIGNSLKSLNIRLYDPDNIKYIESLGDGMTKIRDESGGLLSAVEIMANLGKTIKALPQEGQLDAIKNIFGQYQTNAAASLIQGLEDVNDQMSLFKKNRETSAGAGNNALDANAKLSVILASKLNTLDVQLAKFLNSLGKIGVSNPLSSLLNSAIEIGDSFQGIIDGTDNFSKLVQGFGRGLGGALFSPATFSAILIAIGKISANFAGFAIEAGKTFLGLNKNSLEQAAIQKSIAAYIQQSGVNLNVLLTSESARLNLSRQISAEWAKQAISAQQVGAVSKVVASSVFGAGLRVGETGPTLRGKRSAEGYLPDLVSGEMNDIKKGVGGASSNSKVVVMPNFPLGGGNKGLMVANSSESVVNLGGGKFGVLNPDMMGKRAASGFSAPKATIQNKKGQFIGGTELKSAELNIQLLIELLVDAGASAGNISSALGNFIGAMDLQAKSIKLLIDLGKQHAQSMKDEAIAAQNAAAAQMKMAQAQDAFVKSGGPNLAMMNKGGTGFNSSPELSGLGFRRGKFEPFQKDPFNISSVYTPEKLEQIRKNKVFDQRKQIDGDKRRAEQARQKRLQDEASRNRRDINSLDVNIGETKFKLKTEKNPIEKQKLIRELKTRQLTRGLAASLLSSNEGLLFEKYGADTSKFNKPLSQNQRVNNDALKESLRKRLEGRLGGGGSGGGPNPPKGGFAAFSQNGPLSPDGGLAPVTEKAKKSLVEVAGKLILLQAATDGITAAVGGTESQFGKLSLALSQASLGLVAIGELRKIDSGGFADSLKSSLEKAGEKIKNIGTSGTSDFSRGARAGVSGKGSAADFAEFGDTVDQLDEFGNQIFDVKSRKPVKKKRNGVLSNSRSARAGRAFGGITSGAAGLVSGLAGVGGSLLKFLPILGQGVVIFSTLNQVVEALTGKSGFQMLKEAFGGLTAEAEKSAQAFRDNAKVLFDNSGKAILRNPEEVSQGFRSRLEVAQRERQAKLKGIDTSGKNQDDIANELLGARLDELLSQTKTGGKKEGIVGGTAMIGGVGGAYRPIYGLIDETLGNIDESITTEIKESLQLLSNQTEVGLREFLTSKGISKISGEDIKNLGLDKLQEEVLKLFLDNIAKNISTIKLAKDAGQSRDVISQLGLAFSVLPKEAPQKGNQGSSFFGNTLSRINKFTGSFSPESIQEFLDTQKEIELLTFESSANSIESKIKDLELLSSSPTISSEAKQRIENVSAELQKVVLANSLGKLQAEAKISSDKIGLDIASGKTSALTGNANVEKINKQLGVEEAKIKADIISIDNSSRARNDEYNSLRKLVPIINATSVALSSLSISRSQTEADLALIQAKASNPANGILLNESYQRHSAAKERSLLENSLARATEDFKARNDKINSLPEDQRAQELIDANLALVDQIISINGQIDALDESTRQIGAFGNATQKFADLILEFERGLGENRAQNQFNLLQANDKSSIVSGLIGEQSFDAVKGKSGADLVSSLSEQNAIRQQQFDIATAASKVERLNLETELELNQQIFVIRNSDLSNAEKQLAVENAINANLEKRRTFGFGVREALGGMRDEVNNFGNTFGKTATEGFRDGLVSAMQAAVSQTDNLKDALLDVALTFANKLRDAALTNLANIITSGARGGQGSGSGGIISGIVGAFTGYASGGRVKGGSGSKDDVPTLLMGGEYVVNKKSVEKYGPQFFEALNRGSVGQMAQGGYFAPGVRGQGSIVGKDNLLDFATQTATSGGQDRRRSLMGGAGMVSLEPESLRLSNLNRFGDSPIVQATQEAKDQAFGLYTDQLGQEKQYQEELADYYKQIEEAQAAKKKAEKEKKKQFLISLATAVVSAGISYGLNGSGGAAKGGAKKGGETKYNGGRVRGISESPFSMSSGGSRSSSSGNYKATAYGNADIDYTTRMDQLKADAGTRGYEGFSQTVGASGRNLIAGYSVASNKFSLGTKLLIGGREYRVDDRGGMGRNVIDFYSGSNRSLYNYHSRLGSINPTVLRRNAGGAISGSGDTIPVMASGGEFMLNSSAAKKIGYPALYNMNNGASPSGERDDSAVVARLDELIEKTLGASNVTVNVTVSKDGEQSSQEGNNNQNDKMLAEKLRSAVVQVIQLEQRPGGILSKR